jgi:predicted cobalt transporter CbtA
MKTLTFFVVTLLSGALGGLLLGIINQFITEPFIDKAITVETQRDIAAGEQVDSQQQSQYRIWQKSGEIVAATILGTSLGALFGIVFAYSRKSLLPGSSNIQKAIILAGIMWFVLFFMTALKYPPNPPSVGDPNTIYYRQTLYVAFISISGFSALGAAFLYRKLGNRSSSTQSSFSKSSSIIIAPMVYAAIMIGAYIGLPPNPDAIHTPMDIVTNFRIASVFTMAAYWGIMSVIFGVLWEKFKPHEEKTHNTLRQL